MADELYIGALKIKGFSGSVDMTLAGYICGVDLQIPYSDDLYVLLNYTIYPTAYLRWGDSIKGFPIKRWIYDYPKRTIIGISL